MQNYGFSFKNAILEETWRLETKHRQCPSPLPVSVAHAPTSLLHPHWPLQFLVRSLQRERIHGPASPLPLTAWARALVWSRLGALLTAWGELFNAGAHIRKSTFFPNSPLGNKADVWVSVGLSPLSSLSQCQTLKEPEEEHRESWVLSDTDTAPKDKCCFGASEQKRQHVAGHTEGAVFPLRAWRQASQGRRSLAPSRCKSRSVILVDKWTLSQGDATRMITARLNLLKQ